MKPIPPFVKGIAVKVKLLVYNSFALSLFGGTGAGFPRSLTQAAATLTELRFPSPGLRAQPATLGSRPTNLATLQELRLAEGVTCRVCFHIH